MRSIYREGAAMCLLLLGSACSVSPSEQSLDVRATGSPLVSCDGAQTRCPLPIDSFATYADADSAWIADVDIRGMLRVFHPALVSKSERGAGARIDVRVPAAWRTPMLRLYTTDNYHAATHGPVQNFVGHRFRQIIANEGAANEKLLFSVDVSASDEAVHPPPVEVGLAEFSGQSITLTFRLFDQVASDTFLPEDVWFHPEQPDGQTSTLTEPPRFWILGFFADAVLVDASAPGDYEPGVRPHDREFARAENVHPRGESPREPLVRLRVESPVTIPPAYPLTFTVPFPTGALADTEPLQLRLQNVAGERRWISTRALGYWPDPEGRWSVRVARLTMVPSTDIASGTEYALEYGQAPNSFGELVDYRMEAGAHVLDNHQLRVVSGSDPSVLVGSVSWSSTDGASPLLRDLKLSSACSGLGDQGLSAEVTRRAVRSGPYEDDSPIVNGAPEVVLEAEGILRLAGARVGRFTHRVYVVAGARTLRTELMTSWEVEKPPITKISLCATTPAVAESAAGTVGGAVLHSSSGSLRVSQDRLDHFSASGASVSEGGRLSGWIAAAGPWGEVQASTWRFAEQAPQTLSTSTQNLVLDVFDGAVATSEELDTSYLPNVGEGKRHDVTFTFSRAPQPDQLRMALGELANRPPFLFDRGWWSRTGAFAVVDEDWGSKQPALASWVERNYSPDRPERTFPEGRVGWGLREFGDHSISFSDPDDGNVYKDVWSNGYWENVQGPLHWALGYGNLAWRERAIDNARHISQVGSLRLLPSQAGEPDANHGAITVLQQDQAARLNWSRNENDFAWSAFQVGQSLIVDHWLTGDPESRSAALNNADFLIRRKLPGITHDVSNEPRNAARPMLTLLRAWETTRNEEYRAAAQAYLDNFSAAPDSECDYRRGAQILDVTNYTTVTSGLSAMYAMNAYDYYRETGYDHAARIVLAIADAVYAEAMPAYPTHPETLGDIIFYSRYARTEHYFPQIAILFYQAYDLSRDPRFLAAARATADRYTRFCSDPVLGHGCQTWYNFGWLDPYLGGWMREYPSPESQVTRASQFPDPVNLCSCSPHATCMGGNGESRCGPCEEGYAGDGLSCSTIISRRPGASANASSAMFNSDAWRAIDGNSYGGWSGSGQSSPDNTLYLSDNGDLSPWWELSFDEPQAIEQIIVHNRTDCCSDRLDDYYVCWSDGPFPAVASIESYAAEPGAHCQHIVRSHSALSEPDRVEVGEDSGQFTHIRIQLPQGKAYLQLAEVEVTRCEDDYCP